MGQIERFIKIIYKDKKRQKWRILKEKYRKPEGIKEELTSRQLPLKLVPVALQVKPIYIIVPIGMKGNFITEVKF
jgi:hypothetical protein